jgi:hypothetical protein
MADSPETASVSTQVAWFAAAMAIVPLLYALSMGRALSLATKAARARKIQPMALYHVRSFYHPVFGAAAKTHLDRLLVDYLGWWGIRRVPVEGKVGSAQPGTIVPVLPDRR